MDDEEISAVFCLKPICEDDVVADFVWISSKRQLCKLLERYKQDDFRTVPELIFLKISYTCIWSQMHRENGKRTRKGFCRAVDLKKERIKNKIRETQAESVLYF